MSTENMTVDEDVATIPLDFSVRMDVVKDWEFMMVTGNVEELGDWLPDKAVTMARSITDPTQWSTSVRVRRSYKQVSYRYFVCQYLDSAMDTCGKRDMVILRYESHLLPRTILPALHDKTKLTQLDAIFGFYGGKEMTDVGWLMYQTEIRLRMQQNALEFFKSRHRQTEYAIKITPIDLRFKEMGTLDLDPIDQDSTTTQFDDDSRDATMRPMLPSHTQTCISNLNNNEYNEYNFHDQLPQGQRYHPENDYFVFKTQTVAPEYLGFLVDLYLPEKVKIHEQTIDESDGSTPSPPHTHLERVGFCYILPSNMPDTSGALTVPITSMKHMPIGQITLQYLIVHAMRTNLDRFHMDVSYARHWKKRQTLNVGHRGMGNSYTKMTVCRENTINSLSAAGAHGADYVEFDVQLSRDRVPIIYHDFHVFVTIFKRQGSMLDISKMADEEDASQYMHKLAVKDLRLSQLRMLKLSHSHAANKPTTPSVDESPMPPPLADGSLDNSDSSDTSMPLSSRNSKSARHWSVTGETEDDDNDPDDAPFPTLNRVLLNVNGHVGFNIEVKFPMLQTDGVHECQHYWERNVYIDTILTEVFNTAGKRRILFSSFDPDICTILRLKQNKYPVLFLTMGSHTTRYVPMQDRRCRNTIASMNFAHSTKLLGVNLHSEDVLRDPTHLKEAAKRKLVTFIWGDDLDNKEHMKYLREAGVDGLIYDRMDTRRLSHTLHVPGAARLLSIDDSTKSENDTRLNIFMVEKELKNDLFRMRSRSPCTMDDSSLMTCRDGSSAMKYTHRDGTSSKKQSTTSEHNSERASNGGVTKHVDDLYIKRKSDHFANGD